MSDARRTERKRQRRRSIAEGHIYSAGNKSRAAMLYSDVLTLRYELPLIMWRAWTDTKARYRRSILGPYWLSIGTLTFVVGYSILAGFLFKRPLEDFLGYIAAGVIGWQFISVTLIEGTKIFVVNRHEISSVRVNLLSLPTKQTIRALIAFVHSLPIVLIVIYFTDEINVHTLMLVPGLIILCGTLLPLCALLGTLASRYRDIEQLVAMLIQFFFYMTPIIWKAESLGTGTGKWIALGNPLYYELSIVRLPLLGQPVPQEFWIGAFCFMVFSLLAGALVYGRFRQRIAFWI